MRYSLKPGRCMIELDSSFEGKSTDDFFEAFYISRHNKYLWIENHEILLNQVPLTHVPGILHKGDRITILLKSNPVDYEPSEEECSVVYEDDFVYVAHKEAGIVVHDQNDSTCLAALAARYQINHGIEAPVRYIHRLDRDTSGLVLFVKIPFFQSYFDNCLEKKEIERKYYALTKGKGKEGMHFTYNQKIGRDRHVSGKYRFSSTGKEATTKVAIFKHMDGINLMDCSLLTGRTHQIRVHLSGNRQPIINDPLYGIPDARFSSMCLWAYELDFIHPITKEKIIIKDQMNPDFEPFLQACK